MAGHLLFTKQMDGSHCRWRKEMWEKKPQSQTRPSHGVGSTDATRLGGSGLIRALATREP